ncbi:MAG: glutamyl-tRNA reductase [Planctomycetes bacterium HGW-Planctomycetes-1]|nr:MAG: glutamyl-tRNA reductase [Planctomycetes bacterium HGW-Planctomycetes-1]
MNLFCQSVDFRTCPAAVREKLVLDPTRQELFLRTCLENPQISDALLLNTCNRLEFYFCLVDDFDISAFVDEFISYNGWSEYKQTFRGVGAAEHLFSVAAGIESQIIGENEIFAQLKSAYSFAIRCDMIGFMFHRLLHSAFRLAKAVRTHTDINTGALSIAQAAVELAAVNFNIADAKILIIGSGSNAELIVRHLIRKNAEDIIIVARNKDAAEKLLERNQAGRFLPLNELENHISDADVVFTASSSQKPIITAANLENCHKPLILIDLSVPANIEKKAENIEGIKLFNIDSLNAIININNRKRRGQIPKVKTLIAEHLRTFARWLENLKAQVR